MKEFEEFENRLHRLSRWLGRSEKIIEKQLVSVESNLQQLSARLDSDTKKIVDELSVQEGELKARNDEAGKEFAQNKYKLEKEASANKDAIAKLQEEHEKFNLHTRQELQRINDEKLHVQITYEKQRGALLDLYQQQRNNLLKSREKLLGRWQKVEEELKNTRGRYEDQIKKARDEHEEKLAVMRNQIAMKEEGWALSLEAMRKNLDGLVAERAGLERSLVRLHDEKDKELESAKMALALSKDQLEIDKATIIEKAEEDQRRCEAEVRDLNFKIEKAEKELQDLIIDQETKRKNAVESFEKEETILKETLHSEAEKRDFEQKVFEQEKLSREKEINRLKEEFEQKKWQWENQIRTLMMQKSVQEAEFDNERMRTDREARSLFRSLEAKRDELRQRLSELKSKYAAIESNSKKEMELIEQRWNWRKNRLWSMWQERLETLRKERAAVGEQMEALISATSLDEKRMREMETREQKKTEDLQELVLHAEASENAKRKQKEIQIELEKTRIIAQIKECETLITEWMDRTKMVQDDVLKQSSRMGDQMNFLEKLLREEEKESDLFLQIFQKALSALGVLVHSDKDKAA